MDTTDAETPEDVDAMYAELMRKSQPVASARRAARTLELDELREARFVVVVLSEVNRNLIDDAMRRIPAGLSIIRNQQEEDVEG